MTLNREQRRKQEALQRKAGINPSTLTELAQEMAQMQKQIVKLVELNRTHFKTMQMIKETCERKGVFTIDDLRETENMYKVSSESRDARIKEIYKQNLSDAEKIEYCLKDAVDYKHGYDRLNASPVRDLNVAPNVVNDYLIEQGYSGLKYRQYAIYLGVPEFMLNKEVASQHEQGGENVQTA